jgi:hypothetical protein
MRGSDAIQEFSLADHLCRVLLGVDFYLRPIYFLNELTYFQEWKNGVESRDVIVAGIRIHYRQDQAAWKSMVSAVSPGPKDMAHPVCPACAR